MRGRVRRWASSGPALRASAWREASETDRSSSTARPPWDYTSRPALSTTHTRARRQIYTCFTYTQADRQTDKHTHTLPFSGPLSGTTRVSRYQKGKTNLDFTGARDSEWQWHQLGHMQVCILLQTDNHASTSPLMQFFYRPDALPAAQPTASKH